MLQMYLTAEVSMFPEDGESALLQNPDIDPFIQLLQEQSLIISLLCKY